MEQAVGGKEEEVVERVRERARGVCEEVILANLTPEKIALNTLLEVHCFCG